MKVNLIHHINIGLSIILPQFSFIFAIEDTQSVKLGRPIGTDQPISRINHLCKPIEGLRFISIQDPSLDLIYHLDDLNEDDVDIIGRLSQDDHGDDKVLKPILRSRKKEFLITSSSASSRVDRFLIRFFWESSIIMMIITFFLF